MRLFLNLDTRSFIESAQFQRAISSLVLKRRDRLPVDVQFMRNGSVVELQDGATGKLGLKADKDFNGTFAASDSEWTRSGSGDATAYRFDLNLNTVQINALFAGVPTPPFVPLMLEIEWAEGDLRTSSNTLAVTLENDIIRGDEGIVEEGGPVYPLPGELEQVAHKGQISGYAGLDESGKVPVGQLPQTGPLLHETTNRFTANHTGWKVGDIIRQLGDSTPASLQIVTVPVGYDFEVFQAAFYDKLGEISMVEVVCFDISAEGLANEIANYITSGISFLNASATGNVVSISYNFPGSLLLQPTFSPSNNPLIQTVFTDGVDGVPSGTFLVCELASLSDSAGYKGLGDTVDFFSGYGPPVNSIGIIGNGYVDLNNGDFYHRSELGWTYVLNIKGPPGPSGSLSRIYNMPPGSAGVRGYATTAEATLMPPAASVEHNESRIYHHRVSGTISGASGAVMTIRVKNNDVTVATHTLTFASTVTGVPFEIDSYYDGSAARNFGGFSKFQTQLPSGVVTSLKNVESAARSTPFTVSASVQFSTNSTSNQLYVRQDYTEY